ncbi:hypothetical protein QBC34DRAFT_44410 [Podospora aff. communis PSN243]|uniref:Zn(2)-C6 fungal-type domain-containing protein n=1 Tax=Podospora aff. communis PSN243 TaxID=3040156 RepID=A0AAV9GU31_9PEZI|nr:hypothetical protein QBC34DRAFT_44410 [Podospora aff. communis PSN243]
MGIASYTDLRYRLPLPDTPPEVLTPDSSSYTARHSEERSWNPPAPLSPPMSSYDPSAKASDMSAGKGQDDSQVRRDAGGDQGVPRLPPLSSLFGPPPPVRPFHSPVSDRPSVFSSGSPLDRSTTSSYFPPVTTGAPIPPPRSTPFQERAPFPSLPRVFPGSSLSREPEPPRPDTRSDYGASSKWSSPQESSRDFSYGPREPYRPGPERFPGPLPGSRRDDDARAREPLPPQQRSAQPAPTTPSSPAISEITLSKDGLGPKIWTGTHFLPRFVKAAEVPGEGMCYFYDDGSHCKTVIDGEAVTAHWGVTKAGKPRKRLAIACVTCREKKIKCDPDYPRCVQCEKFGRVCTFKNAPRGGHNTSPSTPPAEPEDTRRLGPMIRPPPDHVMRPSSHSSESISPRTALRPGSPDLVGPAKRIRVGYEHFTPAAGPRSPMAPTPDTARSALSWHQPELPRIHEDVLCRAWQTDPYVSDPQSVTSTLSSFFAHTDAAALRFLPEKTFTSWVQNNAHRKSPEDLMLVYSVLAVGLRLSGGARSIAHEYSQVARYAADHATLSLQLVQTRILLALYYLSVSRPSDSNDMSSAAISAATCLQLNLPIAESQDATLSAFPYGLTKATYSECRSRTFWSCFVLERLNGLFPARMAILNIEDIFASLPTDVRSFEDGRAVQTPAFEPHFSSLGQSRAGVGIMGYLIELVAVWGEIMTTICRLSRRGAHYGFDFSKFYGSTVSRLDDWKASIPPAFEFSPANLSTIAGEDQGTFILMHLVYHLTMIKLHRHVPPRFLTTAVRSHHVWMSQDHAHKILDVVCAVAKDSGMGRSSMPPPFTSSAIIEAIDVLSAEGSVSDLGRLVDGLALAHSVLEVLGSIWEDAKVHRMAMDHRLDKLVTLRDRAANMAEDSAANPGGVDSLAIQGVRVYMHHNDGHSQRMLPTGLRWQIPDALETRFPQEMDCVYAASRAYV